MQAVLEFFWMVLVHYPSSLSRSSSTSTRTHTNTFAYTHSLTQIDGIFFGIAYSVICEYFILFGTGVYFIVCVQNRHLLLLLCCDRCVSVACLCIGSLSSEQLTLHVAQAQMCVVRTTCTHTYRSKHRHLTRIHTESDGSASVIRQHQGLLIQAERRKKELHDIELYAYV